MLPWVAVSVFSPNEDGSAVSASASWPRRLIAGGGKGEDNPGVWVGLVAAATLTKLTASTDDVVWLLPFVSSEHRKSNVRNILFYLFCMQLVVAISWGFCAGGEALLSTFLSDDGDWPLERILELASAILLSCYTLKLFAEWWKERHEENEDESEVADKAGEPGESAKKSEAAKSEAGQPEATVEESDVHIGMAKTAGADEPAAEAKNTSVESSATPPITSTTPSGSAESSQARDEKYTLSRLFTISMFGSLDDFAVFVSLMLSGVLAAWQLSIGVLLGSLVVVMVCAGAGLCKCVVQVIEKIPLWVIIGAFAIWTFIATFALH